MKDVLIPKSLVRNATAFGGQPAGDCVRGALRIEDHVIVGLNDAPETDSPVMVIPKLVEPHVHLDKCHTVHRLGQIGGDLTCAIERQSGDKAMWTDEDIRNRALRALEDARDCGCAMVRSHVDWNDDSAPPRAWHVLCELAQDWPGLQLAALTGIDQMVDSSFAEEVARHVATAGAALGAFVRGQPEIRDGLQRLFDVATRFDVMLDFHVDEGLGDFNGLEAIADAALVTGFAAPILCGHAVSLMDRDPDNFARIADKCARAPIFICALPTTNLYLQGRNGGTPDRRGITRLRELRAAGVPVLVGSDNVGDAFCPMGELNPMAALHLAALSAHLDPPMSDWLPMITTDAARALGHAPIYVDGARRSDLLCARVAHTTDLVAGRTVLEEL